MYKKIGGEIKTYVLNMYEAVNNKATMNNLQIPLFYAQRPASASTI